MRTRFARPLIATPFGLLEKSGDRFGILLFESSLKPLEVPHESAQGAGEVLAIGQRYIAPHFRRAGSYARRVAKTIGAERRLGFGVPRMQH
jgi:hypothetical protein